MVVTDGVEADDMIGTLATTAAHHSRDAIIVTGDKVRLGCLLQTPTITSLPHVGKGRCAHTMSLRAHAHVHARTYK